MVERDTVAVFSIGQLGPVNFCSSSVLAQIWISPGPLGLRIGKFTLLFSYILLIQLEGRIALERENQLIRDIQRSTLLFEQFKVNLKTYLFDNLNELLHRVDPYTSFAVSQPEHSVFTNERNRLDGFQRWNTGLV